MDVPCEKDKKDICRRIQGDSIQPGIDNLLINNDHEECHDDTNIIDDFDHLDHFGMIESNVTSHANSNISTWIESIVAEANDIVSNEDDGDRDNIMENRPFACYFVNLCKMIPIWSAVSCKFFNSPNLTGSSSSSETYFKNMRQLHGDNIPCSVDDFVKRDLELNNSTVIDASKKYLKLITKDCEKKMKETNVQTECTSKINCPVCKDGNLPTGLHKCISCDKPVHLMDECSVSIGDEEGCGQKRQCMECHQSNVNSGREQSETCEALNTQESWSRKNRSKSSKYMKPVPNWGLLSISQKVTIPRLENGNLAFW